MGKINSRVADMAIDRGGARAPFASDPAKSRGRLFAEPPSPTRNDFRRDCDRIIHATAFRRLAHKTQVFVFHEGDHYRTRLTHTLEVAQIARALARALGVDEDLAEGLALAHDLGHPPFGHAGERALDACLGSSGGFDHNAQALRVVTELERRYPDFDGLNLTWEMLEGLIKHNGPLTDSHGEPVGRYRDSGIPWAIRLYAQQQDLALWSYAGVEAQAAAIADDIAYNTHDIDDGLRAEMFDLGDLAAVPILADILAEVDCERATIEPSRRVHELTRRLITRMIEDVVGESRRRLVALQQPSVESIRGADHAVVGFSAAFAAADKDLKKFLYPRMYRHPRIALIMEGAEGVVRDLYAYYMAHPQDIPAEWMQGLAAGDEGGRARRVADFIAGMTDRYALIEHARYFDSTPELR